MSVTMDEPILYTLIMKYGRLHGLLLNQVVMTQPLTNVQVQIEGKPQSQTYNRRAWRGTRLRQEA